MGQDSRKLGPLLVRLGMVSDDDLAKCYSEVTGFSLLTSAEIPNTPLEDCPLNPKFLKESQVLPLHLSEDTIVVALANPEDEFTCQAIALAAEKQVVVKVADVSTLGKNP